MAVGVDDAGNLRGGVSGRVCPTRRRLFIGSHLDTVPHAGAFDGVLGVVLGLALVDLARTAARFPSRSKSSASPTKKACASACPSSAAARWSALSTKSCWPDGTRRADGRATPFATSVSIRAASAGARADGDRLGYLEFHIEQGPVLDGLGLPLGVVDAHRRTDAG